MWPIIVTLFLFTTMLIFKIAEGIWELDHWIDETDKRWTQEYDYINDKFVKKPKLQIQQKIEQPVQENKIDLKIENFPKTSEDAKAKIARLMKNNK